MIHVIHTAKIILEQARVTALQYITDDGVVEGVDHPLSLRLQTTRLSVYFSDAVLLENQSYTKVGFATPFIPSRCRYYCHQRWQRINEGRDGVVG
jgi:hypothetical protein